MLAPVPRTGTYSHSVYSLVYDCSGVNQETGLGQQADIRSRSVRVRNLPANTQEGLLQQFLEKFASVKRVEVFSDQNEAIVELENVAVGCSHHHDRSESP